MSPISRLRERAGPAGPVFPLKMAALGAALLAGSLALPGPGRADPPKEEVTATTVTTRGSYESRPPALGGRDTSPQATTRVGEAPPPQSTSTPATTSLAAPPGSPASSDIPAPPLGELRLPEEVGRSARDLTAEFLRHVADQEVVRVCSDGSPLVHVDHPDTEIHVLVVGDSLTKQSLSAFTADDRFDWTVAAVCGARIEHFLGIAKYTLPDFLEERTDAADAVRTFELKALLDAGLFVNPDVVVIALGSNDVLFDLVVGRPSDYGPRIAAMLDVTASRPCRGWIDLHADVRGSDAAAISWRRWAAEFDSRLRSESEKRLLPVADWSGVVASVGPERTLLPDRLHLTNEGIRLRAELVRGFAGALHGYCGGDPQHRAGGRP
ncbi:MAG: hypothetical protein KatS3mg008_0807 [Acidimicrobiales bacterium]|nr:MAG: hypothetical protein KatS3mg008_0807 [Acidimicrobiales bacterium]